MNSNIRNLIRIARRVSQDNPILGHELKQAALSYAANDESSDGDPLKLIEGLKEILEGLNEEIKTDGTDPESQEFKDQFEKATSGKIKKLKNLFAASRVAAGDTDKDKDIKFLNREDEADMKEWLIEVEDFSKEPSEGGLQALLKGLPKPKGKGKDKGRRQDNVDPGSFSTDTEDDSDVSESQQLVDNMLKTLNPDKEVDVLINEILALAKKSGKGGKLSSALPILVRIAHARPEYRPILLPFIKRISSLPIAIQRTASLNALTAIVKRVKRVAS